MKKILFLAACVAAFSTQSFSQASFGIQVGGNLAFTHLETQTSSTTSGKVNTDPKFGVVGGFVSEFQLGPVSLRPELNFIQKGYKTSNGYFGGAVTTDNKVTLNYLELPVNVTFNIPSNASHFFVGLGPVFSLGLSGKSKFKGSIGNASSDNTTDINFDGDKNATDNDYHLKRFDFGADIITGYKLSGGFTLGLGYTFGISNILPGESNSNNSGTSGSNNNSNSWRNNALALKVGYMFGGGNTTTRTKTTTTTTTNM